MLTETAYKERLDDFLFQWGDYDFFVKPHPTEVRGVSLYRELGMTVLDPAVAGEYILAKSKPDVVVGFVSGLLLTSLHIYSLETYFISRESFGLSAEAEVDDSILSLFEPVPEFGLYVGK